jgi:hypothetical protein
VFDVFDIDTQEYLNAELRYDIVSQLGLQHVPIIDREYELNLTSTPINKLIETADGLSFLSDNPRFYALLLGSGLSNRCTLPLRPEFPERRWL